jgi:hypothetical protein
MSQRLPRDELHPIGRAIVRIFGEDRLDRWAERMEKRHPWLVDPQGEERCPWITGTRVQCKKRVGHEGFCRTERSVQYKPTGKWTVEDDYWRGINYEVGR